MSFFFFYRKANQSDLRGAIDDFRKALEVNPKHRNGRKYLIETSLSLARRYEAIFLRYHVSTTSPHTLKMAASIDSKFRGPDSIPGMSQIAEADFFAKSVYAMASSQTISALY